MISYNLIIIIDEHYNVSQCGNIKQNTLKILIKCHKITFFAKKNKFCLITYCDLKEKLYFYSRILLTSATIWRTIDVLLQKKQ